MKFRCYYISKDFIKYFDKENLILFKLLKSLPHQNDTVTFGNTHVKGR
jgi:hypothetical protein